MAGDYRVTVLFYILMFYLVMQMTTFIIFYRLTSGGFRTNPNTS